FSSLYSIIINTQIYVLLQNLLSSNNYPIHSTHPASVWRCCAAMGLSRMHQCCCREEISSAHLRSLPVGSAVSWTYCWALWSILSQSYISDIAELFKVDYGMLCYLTQKMRRKQMPWMQYKGACTIMVYIATMTGLSHHGPWSNRKLILDTIMVLYPAAAARPARDAATVDNTFCIATVALGLALMQIVGIVLSSLMATRTMNQ
ncbi:unnamed protein product, partial [Ranitomeya imitator]